MGGKKIQARSSKLAELSITLPYKFPGRLAAGTNEFTIEKLLGKLLSSLLCGFSALKRDYTVTGQSNVWRLPKY
jgi:hypothetical protein